MTSLQSLPQLVLFLVVLTDFAVLGSSRLSACIRAIALQGFLLGLLPPLVHASASAHTLALAGGTILVKAIVLPTFLRWAIRETSVRREVEPLIGYMASLLLGVTALAASFAVANVLPSRGSADMLIPVALLTVILGLLVLITRTKALTQVVGYLVMENGVYAFGAALAVDEPLLVELGVLLDVLVAVFVMGIAIYHISREFDHIDTDQLSALRD